MSELPYTTGLTDEFTALVPTSVSASEWVNQKGTTNFILQNAEFADNTITLVDSNIAYLPIAEPTEYTAYILCKTYIPTYKNGWVQFWGCRNGTDRCYVGTSMYNNTSTYKIRTYRSSTYVEPTMDNWHVITVKRTGGYYYVYADGELIISEANTATTRGDKFMIKSITDTGSTPTVDEAITVYLKYCAIFNVVQTDDQIKENTNQILVDFGLKAAEKNSRLSGTDVVAIAYAIARNQESAAALQEMKKAYREGVKRGNDGIPDDNEPVNEVIDDEGSTPIEPPMDEKNPDDVDKRGADMYYTIQSGEGETATTYYLRIYTQKETGIGSSDRGTYKYAWTYLLVYDLYNSEGELIVSEIGITTCPTYASPSNAWYFKPYYIASGYDSYNMYMYVEKVECIGRKIIVYYVTVSGNTGGVLHGTNTTTVSRIPDGATVTHTNSEKPF